MILLTVPERMLATDEGVHLSRGGPSKVEKCDNMTASEAQTHRLPDPRQLTELPQLGNEESSGRAQGRREELRKG